MASAESTSPEAATPSPASTASPARDRAGSGTPGGRAAGRGGRIYVVDSENHRIVRISDMAARGWTVLGRPGSGVREFSSPAGLALDARGRIYVADSGNHRTLRMDDITGAGWTTF